MVGVMGLGLMLQLLPCAEGEQLLVVLLGAVTVNGIMIIRMIMLF